MRIYFDFASTTPLDKRVLKKMKPFLGDQFGNPSALYEEGIEAKKALMAARLSVARTLGVRSEEIIFTGSGTEADNLALLGVFEAARKQKPGAKLHLITTTIEHPAILETCKEIERRGGEVSYIEVEKNGIVDPKKIIAAIRPETVLISIMYANNEIGTIQPIKDISRGVKVYRAEHASVWPYVHTDASQAPNYLSCLLNSLGVDLLTLDASKIYGPKGVGALVIKRDVSISPIMFGGGQERGRRAGTENLAGIIGLAEALTIAEELREKESLRLTELRDYFIDRLLKLFPNAHLNGDRKHRLPNNINTCVSGLNAEFAVIQLDEKGIACASVSSCKNLSENATSYVIEALGEEGKDCGESSLRFSLGRSTTKKEIDRALRVISNTIKV